MLGTFIRQYYGPAAFVPGEIFVSHALEDAALIEESALWSKGPEGPADAAGTRGKGPAAGHGATQCRKRAAQPAGGPHVGPGYARAAPAAASDRRPRHVQAATRYRPDGVEPVAGMVVFVDGKPEKSAYRRFLIQTVETPDDYASMSETRRPGSARRSSKLLGAAGSSEGDRGGQRHRRGGCGKPRDRWTPRPTTLREKDERLGETQEEVFVPNRVILVPSPRRWTCCSAAGGAPGWCTGFADASISPVLVEIVSESCPRRRPRSCRAQGSAGEAFREHRSDPGSAARGIELALPGFNRQLAEAMREKLSSKLEPTPPK